MGIGNSVEAQQIGLNRVLVYYDPLVADSPRKAATQHPPHLLLHNLVAPFLCQNFLLFPLHSPSALNMW